MKRFLCFAFMAMLFYVSYAQKVKIDGVTYKIDKRKGEATVTSGSYKLEEVYLLDSIEYNEQKYPVTVIADGAFVAIAHNRVKKLSIPNSIKRIGSNAFTDSPYLEEVVLPDNPIYIDSTAFSDSEDVKIARCQNGSFPTYIDGVFSKKSPVAISLKNKQNSNNDIKFANSSINQNTSQSITPLSSHKTPSSDVDVNIPVCKNTISNTFVVIFANEKYQDETNVEYAENDGEVFKNYCCKALGIQEDNVHLRKNATRNNMIAEISWMKKVSNAYNGEVRFIVFYAGHGVSDEKSGYSYLLPVDGIGTELETAYSLELFYKTLGNIPATNITIFIDACFSGAIRGEGMLTSARGVAIKAKSQEPQGDMVIFSAAQGDETAYPFKEKEHGLFTYYLLKKLKETEGDVTYYDLANYICENVQKKSIVTNKKSQTPSVIPSKSLMQQWKTMKMK